MNTRSLLRKTAAATLGAAALAGVVSAAAPAGAAPAANYLIVFYDTRGTTHIQRADTDIPLGRSQITATLRPSGKFTADLPIPTARVAFDAFGYLPIAADVSFVQVAPATGALTTNSDGRSSVTTTARYVVQLRNVFVGGEAANVGPYCQTDRPVTLNLATPDDGPGFNIISGGTITGTYTIGTFKNCSTTTDLTNIIVPGDGNTVSVTLRNGRITTPGTPMTQAQHAALSRAGQPGD